MTIKPLEIQELNSSWFLGQPESTIRSTGHSALIIIRYTMKIKFEYIELRFFVIAVVILISACRLPESNTGLETDNIPELEKQIDYRYLSHSEIETGLDQLQRDYPDLIKLEVLSPDTEEGRSITAVKLSDNAVEDEDEPVGVFISGQHAREWLAIAALYYMLHNLTYEYRSNADVRLMVDETELWFVPVVNPDGYVYTHANNADRLWRKNRHKNSDGSFGVDLNRNWDYKWAYNDTGSSPDTRSNIYRGLKPFSEPETMALKSLLERVVPNVFIDFHTYSQLVLYPYGYDAVDTKNPELHQLAENYAQAVYTVHGNRYTVMEGHVLYPHNGNAMDYVYERFKIPSLTLELRPASSDEAGFSPPESEIQPTVEENLAGLTTAIAYIRNRYFRGAPK